MARSPGGGGAGWDGSGGGGGSEGFAAAGASSSLFWGESRVRAQQVRIKFDRLIELIYNSSRCAGRVCP